MTNTTRRQSSPAPLRIKRKTTGLRARVLGACFGLALVAGLPGTAHAQSASDDTSDARLQGYGNKTTIEKSGVATTWMLFLALSVIGCSVLFKNANRSHLD